MVVALRLLRLARASSSLEQCLVREYRAALEVFASDDFREGVRAAVIDKDRNPRWSPPRIADVTPEMVAPYFADIGELISFILVMVIGFGIVFELPVILFILGMLRIISSRWLYKNRVWWFLGLGLLANFLTPGVDPFTPLVMFIPLYVFFEGTALLLKLLKR